MELNVDIKIVNKNEIAITDNTSYQSEKNPNAMKDSFRKSDIIAMTLIQTYETSGKSTVIAGNTLDSDGWYAVHYIVMPSVTWYRNAKDLLYRDHSLLGYSIVYFTDGEKVYKFLPSSNKEEEVTDLKELISNPNNTTVYTVKEDFVLMWQLYNCYINYCKKIFDSTAFSKCFNKTKDNEAIYYRDLIWMAINIINYLVKDNLLAEALRIIELFHSCNGICPTTKNNTYHGCGCS